MDAPCGKGHLVGVLAALLCDLPGALKHELVEVLLRARPARDGRCAGGGEDEGAACDTGQTVDQLLRCDGEGDRVRFTVLGAIALEADLVAGSVDLRPLQGS